MTGFEDLLRTLIRDEIGAAERRLSEKIDAARRPQPPPAAQGMLSIKEAAELAHFSEKTIRKWVCSGALPASRPGRLWRISRDALTTFLAKRPASNDDGDDLADRLYEKAQRKG